MAAKLYVDNSRVDTDVVLIKLINYDFPTVILVTMSFYLNTKLFVIVNR